MHRCFKFLSPFLTYYDGVSPGIGTKINHSPLAFSGILSHQLERKLLQIYTQSFTNTVCVPLCHRHKPSPLPQFTQKTDFLTKKKSCFCHSHSPSTPSNIVLIFRFSHTSVGNNGPFSVAIQRIPSAVTQSSLRNLMKFPCEL